MTVSGRPNALSKALHAAIIASDLSRCEQLIRAHVPLDFGHEGCCGCSPVLVAVEGRQHDIAELLIKNGFSVHGETCEQGTHPFWSSLHLAMRDDKHNEFLAGLLAAQDPGEFHLEYPIHPLHVASERSNDSGLEVLLKHCMKSIQKSQLPETTEYGMDSTILHQQPRTDETSGMSNPISELEKLQISSVVNAPMHHGMGMTLLDTDANILAATPLHVAAFSGSDKCASTLLKYGASIDLPASVDCRTPLHCAAMGGGAATASLLLNAGANAELRDSSGMTPLMVAAEHGNQAALSQLLNRSVNLSSKCFRGRDALYHAALGGNASTVSYLLQHGIKTSTPDAEGISIVRTMLAKRDYYGMRSLALNEPALFEQIAWDDVDPILYSVGETKMLKLTTRAILRHRSSSRLDSLYAKHSLMTPLGLAISASNLEALHVLLQQREFEVNDDSCDEGSPIIQACLNGFERAVEVLTRGGAKIAYVREGQVFNAVQAAERYPLIQQFLLVGRYTRQRKLLERPFRTSTADRVAESNVQFWSGLTRWEIPLIGKDGRFGNESTLDWAKRLKRVQRNFAGKVVARGGTSNVFISVV